MAKKKQQTEEEKLQSTLDEIEALQRVQAAEQENAKDEDEFISDGKAYLPVWNETFKRYDMLIIHVNTVTFETYIEREPTRATSDIRAQHELLQRVSADFMKNKGGK